MSNLRKISRADYGTRDGDPTHEEIRTGCLQRMADAAELAARNHQRLVDKAAWAKRDRDHYQQRCETLERSNAALRGHLKRMKRERDQAREELGE